jgi:membrane-associated phospholipid phosphatase
MKQFIRKNCFWLSVGLCAALYVILMCVLTPYDYAITNGLYNPGTLYGKIFEVLGPILMPFAGIYAIVSVLMTAKINKTPPKVLVYVLLGVLYVYYFFIGSFTCKYSYLPALFVPAIVSYVAWTAGSVLLNKYIAKKGLTEIHVKIAWVIFWTVFAAMLGCDVIKLTFGRIRYIKLTDGSEFLPWFVVQSHEFNSSFPSGHASRAAIVLVLPLLLRYSKNESKALNVCIYLLCFVFICVVSVSRLFEGMHYPTDILTGAFLTSMAFFVSKHFLIKN